MFARFSSTLRK